MTTAGDQGWELVTMNSSGSLICFKRPRVEPAAPVAPTPPAS